VRKGETKLAKAKGGKASHSKGDRIFYAINDLLLSVDEQDLAGQAGPGGS
jgi:hypothetical protein